MDNMATTWVYRVCMAIATTFMLLAVSSSASANGLPSGRTGYGTASASGFSELSTQADSKNPDSFLVSFSDWTFQIEYVKSGYVIPDPVDMNEISKGIYSPGAMNWRMKFSILEVFEFNNTGDESFGPEDTVISSVDLSEENYTVFSSVENTPNWGVRNTFTAISQDGLMTLVFVIVSDYVFYDLGGDLDPTEINLNVRISRYAFSDESNALGLRIMIESQSSGGMSFQESNVAASLNASTSQPFAGGEVSVNKFVNADGVEWLPSWTTWDEGNITCSYQRANTVMQNFVFKVRSNMTYHSPPDSLEPNASIYLIGLVAAAASITSAVMYVKRGRHQENS